MAERLTTDHHTETLSGGLVTSRPSNMLGPGELQRADNAIYVPGSDAPHSIGGRFRFPSQIMVQGSPQDIKGLITLIPNPAATVGTLPIIIAATDNKWYSLSPGEWDEWIEWPIESSGGPGGFVPGYTLKSVYYPYETLPGYDGNNYDAFQGLYFISDGGSIPQYLFMDDYSAITKRRMGMAPMQGREITLDRDSGTFGSGSGYWFYWITEYDARLNIENENVPLLDPGLHTHVLHVIDDEKAQRMKITINYTDETLYSNTRNFNATHWRVYRAPSPGGEVPSDTWIDYFPFPIGNLIAVEYTKPGSSTASWVTEIPIPGKEFDSGSEPQATVVYDEGSIGSGVPYPAIVITDMEGNPGAVSRDARYDGRWSSGTIFEDSLVVNNSKRPGIVQYSAAGRPMSFPAVYWINFKTLDTETVTYIGSIGEVCVVGTEYKLWRLNTLPRPADPIFSAGRVKTLVSSDYGIVGPSAATNVTLENGVQRLAFISRHGVHLADGITTMSLSDDIDWSEISVGAHSALVNVGNIKCLALFYNWTSDPFPNWLPYNSHVLFFSYDPRHLKNGRFKVSGPITLAASAAMYSEYEQELYTGSKDGYLSKENQPITDENVMPIDSEGMYLKTRIIYPAGLHNEIMLSQVRAYIESGVGGAPNALHILKQDANEGEGSLEIGAPITMTDVVWKKSMRHVVEGVGAEYRGFSPLHFVGFEYTKQRGR